MYSTASQPPTLSARAKNAPAGPASGGPGEPAVRIDPKLLMTALACLLVGFVIKFDVAVVYVAQPTFMAVFHTPQVTAAWTATGYTLASAVAIAPSAWAINRFGARRLVVGSVLLFTVSSVLCAMAPSITLLIAARVVQGISCGLLLPSNFTVLIRAAGPIGLGRVMSLVGIPMLLGPILGPVLGGWLIDTFGWQWIFLINVPLGVLIAVLATLTLTDGTSGQDEPLELIEVLLLSPGIAALLYGLAKLPEYATIAAPQVFAPAAAGAVMVTGFVGHALHRTQNPMIDIRLLRRRAVCAANTVRLLFAMSSVGAGLFLPLYFQQVLGASSMHAGMLFVPQAISAAVCSPVVGRITDQYGPRAVVLVGAVLSATGMGLFILAISQAQVPMAALMAALAVIGIGTSCSLIPLPVAAAHQLNDRDTAHGSTLLLVNHNIAGAIGIAGGSMLLAGLSELSVVHAYTIVLGVSAGIGALSVVPAAFLPTKTRPR